MHLKAGDKSEELPKAPKKT